MGIAISTLLGARDTKESSNLQRTKVIILNDCWLDVFKFLTCAEWSEKRYVSRQINGIGQRNISRLPRAIIEMAMLGEKSFMPKLLQNLSDVDDAIVAFGEIIPQSEIAQWFVNRGITLHERVQFRPLFSRIRSGGFLTEHFSDFADICILGPAQQLVKMYAVNQNFVDAVKEKFADNFSIPGNAMHTQKLNTNKLLYIHCETFLLLFKSNMNVDGLSNALIWLKQNVRAESIRMPSVYTHSQDRAAVCSLFNNFVFGALRICAKRELRLYSEIGNNLLIRLVKEFPTLPRIDHKIPTIVIEAFSSNIVAQIEQEYGQNMVNLKVNSAGALFLYAFENGHNRMRILFLKRAVRLTYDCYVKLKAV